MFVGTTFPGDEDRELMWLQHDLWFKLNGAFYDVNGLAMGSSFYIFGNARAALLFNTGENPLFFPERERLPQLERFDHRVLQFAHHKMASFYRWIVGNLRPTAFSENPESRKAFLLDSWKTYLNHEVSNLTFGNLGFSESVVRAVLFENTDKGYEAEDWITSFLDNRYGEYFTSMCTAHARKQGASDGNQGYLYVLVNPAFRSNFLKIGKTTRTPSERAEEIGLGTGVPLRFYVVYEALVSDCHAAERIVHERLKCARSTTNREFFEVPLKDAIWAISEVASHFAPNRSVQPPPAGGRG